MPQNTRTEDCVPGIIPGFCMEFPLEMRIDMWQMRSGQGPVEYVSCRKLVSSLDTPLWTFSPSSVRDNRTTNG